MTAEEIGALVEKFVTSYWWILIGVVAVGYRVIAKLRSQSRSGAMIVEWQPGAASRRTDVEKSGLLDRSRGLYKLTDQFHIDAGDPARHVVRRVGIFVVVVGVPIAVGLIIRFEYSWQLFGIVAFSAGVLLFAVTIFGRCDITVSGRTITVRRPVRGEGIEFGGESYDVMDVTSFGVTPDEGPEQSALVVGFNDGKSIRIIGETRYRLLYAYLKRAFAPR